MSYHRKGHQHRQTLQACDANLSRCCAKGNDRLFMGSLLTYQVGTWLRAGKEKLQHNHSQAALFFNYYTEVSSSGGIKGLETEIERIATSERIAVWYRNRSPGQLNHAEACGRDHLLDDNSASSISYWWAHSQAPRVILSVRLLSVVVSILVTWAFLGLVQF